MRVRMDFTPRQMRNYIADLEAENERLREALEALLYYNPEHDNYYYRDTMHGVGEANYKLLREALAGEGGK